jgi:hypothetical protein
MRVTPAPAQMATNHKVHTLACKQGPLNSASVPPMTRSSSSSKAACHDAANNLLHAFVATALNLLHNTHSHLAKPRVGDAGAGAVAGHLAAQRHR